jgi:hypothetical protein
MEAALIHHCGIRNQDDAPGFIRLNARRLNFTAKVKPI